MDFPVLRVHSASALGNTAQVTLDGQPLTSVTDITVEIGVDRLTTATIRMYVTPDLDLPVEVIDAD